MSMLLQRSSLHPRKIEVHKICLSLTVNILRQEIRHGQNSSWTTVIEECEDRSAPFVYRSRRLRLSHINKTLPTTVNNTSRQVANRFRRTDFPGVRTSLIFNVSADEVLWDSHFLRHWFFSSRFLRHCNFEFLRWYCPLLLENPRPSLTHLPGSNCTGHLFSKINQPRRRQWLVGYGD